MAKSHKHLAVPEDIDIAALGRALWRAKGWILGLAIGAGVVTFIALSMMRPLYTSEARILIQNDELAFTRPTTDLGRDPLRATLDEQAVQSQVQVLTSRDLAVEVIKALDLINNPQFAKDAGVGFFRRMFRNLGLWRGSPQSEEEKAANAFAEHLSVFPLSKSSVIAVEYTSGDSQLAAEVTNKLADVYIDWQRRAKLEQTKDATAWLSAQIEVLRTRVSESEEAAEQFRASKGLYEGTNNVTLNAQQLSELNSQLILAKAQRSEAEARARLIKTMLADNGDIDATPEVLSSQLIGRLIEQRVQVQRQLAELSATLLPSHPRIKQLTSELADVRSQIRDEATKIVKGLENAAAVASARETSLRTSLNDVKTQASGLGDAEIKLRALEREAKANRDLLESYLARYRDASARHDMGAVPAQAAIVSRAHAAILPSFPKRGPITLLVTAATALLALAFVMARELMGVPEQRRQPLPANEPRMRERRVPRPAETPPPPPPAPPVRQPAASAPRPEPAIILSPPAAAPQAVQASAAASAVATAASEPAPKQQPLRPSWPRAETNTSTPPLPDAPKPVKPMAAAEPVKPEPAVEPALQPADPRSVAADLPAATGFIGRLRRGLASGQAEKAEGEAPAKSGNLLSRLRQALPTAGSDSTDAPAAAPALRRVPQRRTEQMSMHPNDLRSYLSRRIAATAPKDDKYDEDADMPPVPKAGIGKVGPVLKSLDAVLNHVVASAKGNTPRALLVAGVSDKVDATQEAIQIARSLVARREQVVLVDLTKGAAAVSSSLGLPRAPGFIDLAAGRARFEDVVRIDPATALQVIAAGNPAVKGDGDEADRFMRVFEALTEAYDSVVLHADRDTVRKLRPALKFELPAVVAILPVGGTAKSEADGLGEFSSLGCPVVVYEQSGKEPRKGLLGRVAAI